MILAMILAHLVGDYILQWNSLAAWKSQSIKGISVHCFIVFIVTWVFALPFENVWGIVLLISVMHFVIDAGQFLAPPKLPPLQRFVIDQLAHFLVIFSALLWGGYLNVTHIGANWSQLMHDDRLMVYALAYAFLTMPAWVIIKFTVYGLIKGSGPNFADSGKYLGILERVLMATFVLMGQFILLPFVATPRLMVEWRQVAHSEQTAVYLGEWLVSIVLAVIIGLLLA